jgi:lipoprotein signal peptidase
MVVEIITCNIPNALIISGKADNFYDFTYYGSVVILFIVFHVQSFSRFKLEGFTGS